MEYRAKRHVNSAELKKLATAKAGVELAELVGDLAGQRQARRTPPSWHASSRCSLPGRAKMSGPGRGLRRRRTPARPMFHPVKLDTDELIPGQIRWLATVWGPSPSTPVSLDPAGRSPVIGFPSGTATRPEESE